MFLSTDLHRKRNQDRFRNHYLLFNAFYSRRRVWLEEEGDLDKFGQVFVHDPLWHCFVEQQTLRLAASIFD